jgi:hypothetical protein
MQDATPSTEPVADPVDTLPAEEKKPRKKKKQWPDAMKRRRVSICSVASAAKKH